MKQFFMTFLFLLCTAPLRAQDSLPVRHSLRISMGYIHSLNKDIYHSPFTYHSFLSTTDVRYTHTRAHSMHSLYAVYMSGAAQTAFSPLAAEHHVRFSYEWLFQIHRSARVHLYAGPAADAYGWRLNYFPELKKTHVQSWYAAVSVHASVFLTYRLNERNTFYFRGSMLLAGYADRPDLMDGNKAYAAGFMPAWNSRISLSWEHRFTRHVSLLVRYEYSYLSTDVPRPVHMLQNGLSFGLVFRFGSRRK